MSTLPQRVTTSMVYHAAARGIPLESAESRLEGELDLRGFLGLDPKVRKGFKNVNISERLTGPLSEAQKQEVVDLGCRFSPVYDMVTNTVPVSVVLAS